MAALRAWFAYLAATGLTVAPSVGAAPPWFTPESTLEPLPKSVEIARHDQLLYVEPSTLSQRRGAARLAARLPVFANSRGADCPGRWLLVGALAWLCDEHARPSDWPADAAGGRESFADGLPYRYHFVGRDGSFGYSALNLAEEGVPDVQLEPGFSVAVVRVEPKPSSREAFALTSHDVWLPVRDLVPVNPSSFVGVELEQGATDAAWIASENAAVYQRPGQQRTPHVIPPLTRVTIDEEQRVGGISYYRLSGFGWVNKTQVRRASVLTAPADLLPNERWISVDLENQTLTAYEGAVPVFATLVSTGRGAPGSDQATPTGEHRIWVKLRSTDMNNLEETEAGHYYAIDEVPWVMFFKGGYGLHGAFWHRSFGNRRSHGCVNLSPLDAQRLFHWTSPRLPSGWHAVHPTAHDLGTRIVVH